MKKIFISISPGFYKTKLLTEISKKIDILVIYTTDYDASSRNKDFLSANREFPFICLTGPKLFQSLKLFWILLTTKYDECIIGGYVSFSEWIPVLISKKKNALILESTFRETTTKGLKVLMKRFFFSRLHRVYACGSPHEKLARMFGFKGEVEKWYSVGLINQVAQPVYKPRQEVKKFLFIGRLIWQKNLSWLIDRFNDHPELSLDIIGYGEDEVMLKQKVMGSNIRFLGAVDNDKLYKYYQDSDVFILPSISETWGLVVEEALNNGTPVMLSNMVGAADDMVKNTGFGVVFKTNDIDDFEQKLSEITTPCIYNAMRKNISSLDYEFKKKSIINIFCK